MNYSFAVCERKGWVEPLSWGGCWEYFQGRLAREDIDVRMCKALADLPTDQGLEAVDKFASANLDSVRSKTGFMVGPRAGSWGWRCPPLPDAFVWQPSHCAVPMDHSRRTVCGAVRRLRTQRVWMPELTILSA